MSIVKAPLPHVFVAIPSARGFSCNELFTTILHWCADKTVLVTIEFYQYLQPIDNARNRAVEKFLEVGASHLFFVDDDIVPPHDCLRRLLRHKKRIVAPVCFSMKEFGGAYYPYPVTTRGHGDEQEIHCGEGLDWVDNIGTGAVLLRREVVEKLKKDGPLFRFEYDKNGIVTLGEDYHFSRRARESGEDIWVDYSIHCKHYRKVDIREMNDLMVAIQRTKAQELEAELCKSATPQ